MSNSLTARIQRPGRRPSPVASDEADRRIRAHFDEFAPEYHATAFDGAGMAHLSSLDLHNVRRAAALVRAAVLERAEGSAGAGTGAEASVPQACDIGVGTGRISSELLRLGFRLVGVDASPGMLAEAEPVLDGATLRLGSLADRLPVDDGHADLVTCMRVVKYLPAWRGAVAELARITRPGGILCFDLANAHSPARFGYPSGMVWPSTYADAEAAIDAAGLDVVELRPGVHLPDPVWRAAAGDRTANLARAVEATTGAVLGRHGARSWTFIARKRAAS